MYNVIHFEALGSEADHLNEETLAACSTSQLPCALKWLITEKTVQEYLKQYPDISLPSLITIKTHSKIPESWICCSKDKAVITRSAGYDHIEHLSDRVHIASLREYCVNAVAQTAVKLMFAAAGELNSYTLLTERFNRSEAPSFMELGKERIAAVFGVGKIGKAIYDLLDNIGLDVYGVDIRASELSCNYGDSVRFISPEDAVKRADVIVNAMNLSKDTSSRFYNAGYFSDRLLSLSAKPFIFINVTRGEIAPEDILLKKLKDGSIYGLGLDVFSLEADLADVLKSDEHTESRFDSARELIEMSMKRSANVYVQPHQGFNSDIASKNKAKESIKLLGEWFRNNRFNEELPYYS